jgi:peptidoglycan/LPS O-acetylase OafA/YrhL
VLYSFVIFNTISARSLINLEIQPFTYLGIISYGLYMYHMLVDYILRFICMRSFKKLLSENFFGPLIYHISLLGFTIIVAGLSYKYLESYFLKLKVKYS